MVKRLGEEMRVRVEALEARVSDMLDEEKYGTHEGRIFLEALASALRNILDGQDGLEAPSRLWEPGT